MPIPAGYKPKPLAEGKKWDAVPDDIYQLELFDVSPDIDTYKGEEKDVWKFECVILDDAPFIGTNNGEQNTRGRRAWFGVTQICSPASKDKSSSFLYDLAKAVYGRDLTDAECRAIREDPTPLLHKQFKAALQFKVSANGNEYNKLKGSTIMPARKLLPAYDPEVEGGKRAASAETADETGDEPPF